MIVESFKRARWRDRLGHAFLITGGGESEQGALIESLLSIALCTASDHQQWPCEQCRSCQWLKDNAHPNVYELGKNGAVVSIEALRECTSLLQMTAHQSGYRIIVLYHVEQYSAYVMNALLKNLEEPPNQTVFFLTAMSERQVLPTVRSRCIHIRLPLVKRPIEHGPLKEYIFWGETLACDDETVAERVLSDIEETLYLFYYWVAEFGYYRMTQCTEYLSNPTESARYGRLSQMITQEATFIFLDEITDAIQAVRTPGVNKILLWSALMGKWRMCFAENGPNE